MIYVSYWFDQMTVLSSSNYRFRGYFDPVTLGLHAPIDFKDMTRYIDDVTVSGAATFVHELSHYMQFYGTVFGYTHLLSLRGCLQCIEDGMKSMAGKGMSCFPASSWPIDIGQVFPTEELMAFYTQAILLNRYYNEELKGLTYAHFGSNQPIAIDGNLILTSPLYLEQEGGNFFPFTGEALLENYAVCQEVQFLTNHFPREITMKHLEQSYLSIPFIKQVHYQGIGVWMGTFKLHKIEPLLYFTLLNQPHSGVIRRLGDYTLAFNTKKVFTTFNQLKELSCPKTNDETRKVFTQIAEITGLADPLDVLSKWRDILRPTVERRSWIVDWISSRIWDWLLSEPIKILTWPENLPSILGSIPLLNVLFENHPGENINNLNISQSPPSEYIGLVKSLHDYSERLYITMGLYNDSEIRCPHIWKEKPVICESCDVCPGYLPDNIIGNDCPVRKDHGDLLDIVYQNQEKGD
jgi:hypothetical protein